MSLKSVVSLIDDKLHDVFHARQPDAKKARRKALKTIDTARRQYAATEPTRGRKIWAASNEVVRFTPGYAIDGRESLFVPAARFNDMLDSLEAAINAGELDDALLAGQPKSADEAVVEPAQAPADAPSVKPKRTRDPAATAKAMATRAARKAAQA